MISRLIQVTVKPDFKFRDRTDQIWKVIHKILKTVLVRLPGADPDCVRTLNLRRTSPSLSPRYLLFSSAGILESEVRAPPLYGQLDGIKASNILKGPFKLAITENPQAHLTFERNADGQFLRILSLKQIFAQYTVQRLGFTRY
jgi:hypothetical protein